MTRSFRTAVALVLLSCSLCVAASAVSPRPLVADHVLSPSPSPTPTPTPASEPVVLTKAARKELSHQLKRYLAKRPGRLSIAVRDLATDLSFSYGGKHRPATASIVKANIVAALLLQKRKLSSGEKALAEQAIKVSDNDAADALWYRIGGASGLAKANKKLGLRETTPGPGDAWGATITSAADQVRLLAKLAGTRGPLTYADRRYLLGLMGDVVKEQAWGVSAAASKGDEVALKNGWLDRKADGGLWTINSIGRVRGDGHDYLIAVLSDRHPSSGVGIETVEKATEMVVGVLSDPR